MPLKKIFTLIFSVVLLAYPFFVYLGLKDQQFKILISGLILLFITRCFFSFGQKTLNPIAKTTSIVSIGMILILTMGIFLKNYDLVKLYPLVISLVLAFVFILSLLPNRIPIIEALARLKDGKLPVEAIRYTRIVTIVWVAFFVINFCISAFTYFKSIEIWTLYNGLISYLLMGTIFLVEFLFRVQFKKKWLSNNEN